MDDTQRGRTARSDRVARHDQDIVPNVGEAKGIVAKIRDGEGGHVGAGPAAAEGAGSFRRVHVSGLATGSVAFLSSGGPAWSRPPGRLCRPRATGWESGRDGGLERFRS